MMLLQGLKSLLAIGVSIRDQIFMSDDPFEDITDLNFIINDHYPIPDHSQPQTVSPLPRAEERVNP